MQDLVEISKRYFLGSGDRASRVWIFDEDHTSPFLRSSVHFGYSEFGIHIIDLFGGLQPILLNYDSFTRDEVKITFRPTAILDSNTVSYFHQYVTSQSLLSPQRRQIVFDALQFMISNHLDYNPFFYYMEGAAKDENKVLLKYAEEISLSILTLHTMDEKRFLASGEITIDPNRLAFYANEFGGQKIEEIAPLYARAMIQPTDPEMDGLSHLFYVALLKTGLIHKKSRQGIIKKYKKLQQFMQDELNIALGIERIMALGFFSGQFDDFIPLQRGSNPDRLFKRLRAAAWDLLRLQLPMRFLVNAIEDEIFLGYICTSDRALAQIAQACKFEAVMGLAPKAGKPIPYMSYDLSNLQSKVGNEIVNAITKHDTEWQQIRLSKRTKFDKHITYDEMLNLESKLEAEVRDYCDG